MVKRIVLIAIFTTVLSGCSKEPTQGSCEDGSVELPGPEGTPICTPVSNG